MKDLKPFSKYFADYTELRLQENSKADLTLLNGDVVNNASSSEKGISARTYEAGYWGFASNSSFETNDIIEVISTANENATFLSNNTSIKKGKLPKVFSSSERNGNYNSQKNFTQKEKKEFLQELDSYITKKSSVESRTLNFKELGFERNFLNAENTEYYSYMSRSNVIISLTKMHNGEPINLYKTFGGPGQSKDYFSNPKNLFSDIDELLEKLAKKCEGGYAKPGIHDVVLGSSITGLLAHEAIGHTVEADYCLAGSVAKNLLGQQIASEIVTLADLAYEYNGKICPMPIWIDDEGVKGRDIKIIDKGILKSYLHNRTSAETFKTEPTGNARANAFYDEPLIRMRNTAILPGQDVLADMIASIDNGYYLLQSSNGQADTTSEFMFGIVMGYEIKNGKLGKAIRDCTVSGVAFDMLKTISMVGDKLVWSSGGWCGKKQTINVGMGGPNIRCKINIGGKL